MRSKYFFIKEVVEKGRIRYVHTSSYSFLNHVVFLRQLLSILNSTAHVLFQIVAMGIECGHVSFHGVRQVHGPLH